MALSMHRESNSSGSSKHQQQMDPSKYVRYTPEQVEALERVYSECPKPSSLRRQQLIRECPILSNIEPKQIKVWFQNRRYTCLSRLLGQMSWSFKDFGTSGFFLFFYFYHVQLFVCPLQFYVLSVLERNW